MGDEELGEEGEGEEDVPIETRGFWVAISAILIALFGNVTTIAMLIVKADIDRTERSEAREVALEILRTSAEAKEMSAENRAIIASVYQETSSRLIELIDKTDRTSQVNDKALEVLRNLYRQQEEQQPWKRRN